MLLVPVLFLLLFLGQEFKAKTATLKHLMNLFNKKSKIVHGAYGNKDSDTAAYSNIADFLLESSYAIFKIDGTIFDSSGSDFIHV